jgi:uncharacterized protein
MASGLAALFDDIAVIAKLAAASLDDIGAGAAKAGAKAAGVVVDDAAVTPRYVTGFTPDRELPIIGRIALGSLKNKLLIILPAALLLSALAPWALTPLLMLGGLYLCYEGAEKLWEALRGAQHEVPVAVQGEAQEKLMVAGAIRTDFILSAEIMVIALAQVANLGFWSRATTLVIVALIITVLVYGAVALIVKLDDIGLHLAAKPALLIQKFGRGLVKSMGPLLAGLSAIGMAAMLWVGGGILLHGLAEFGLNQLPDMVHHTAHAVATDLRFGGGLIEWLINAVAAGLFGLACGAIIVGVLHVIPHRR